MWTRQVQPARVFCGPGAGVGLVDVLLERLLQLVGGDALAVVRRSSGHPRRDGRWRELGEDGGRGVLAGTDRAVHVAVPDHRGLGAGPVDRADRLAQGVAEAWTRCRASASRRSSLATTPRRSRSARSSAIGWRACSPNRRTRSLDDERLALASVELRGRTRPRWAIDEADEHALGRAIGVALVEGDLHVSRCRQVTWPLRPASRQNGRS